MSSRQHRWALRAGALAPGLVVAAMLAAGCGLPAGDDELVTSSGAVTKDKKKVTANVQDGILTVTGTKGSDSITLRLSPGDPTTLEIIDGSEPVKLAVKRDKFDHIVVNGDGSNDLLQIDESQGVFTDTEITTLDGGDGDDVLVGGSGAETLVGGDGNDQVDGKRGDDVAFLGRGDDTFVWNPGDGSDVVEGQEGSDTLLFNGSNIGENVALSANGQRARFFRDVASITMDLNGVEVVQYRALGGADHFTLDDLTGTDVTTVRVDLAASAGGGDGQVDAILVNGTSGDDTITVSGDASGVDVTGLAAALLVTGAEAGVDTLTVQALAGADVVNASALPAGAIDLAVFGGAGDDVLTGGPGGELFVGGPGTDVAFLGAGDDTFVWNPGDGSDVVEGQGGTDVLQFHGANIGEHLDLSANGQRLRLSRDVASIVMDLDGVESVELQVLGGADVVAVHDLSGTSVSSVHVDLAAPGGGGDGQADQVSVSGTSGDDTISFSGAASDFTVAGLAAATRISGAEAGVDSLTVDALGGADVVNGASAPSGLALALFGGDGDDFLTGGIGSNLLFGGAGNDTFVWNPGGGSDVVEGGDGSDTLLFNASNIGENLDLSANGQRLRLFRDVANVTLDVAGVEAVQLRTLGGADIVTLGDLAGTGVTSVNVDLAASGGGGDGQLDFVIVNGTAGDDSIVVAGGAAGLEVTGLAASYLITGAEAANDTLVIHALGGTDTVDSSGLASGVIQLVVDGVP